MLPEERWKTIEGHENAYILTLISGFIMLAILHFIQKRYTISKTLAKVLMTVFIVGLFIVAFLFDYWFPS